MKDIVERNLNVTYMLDTESNIPIFALAGKGDSGNMEASYPLLKTYPPILNDLLSQEYSNRVDTTKSKRMRIN